MPTAAAGLHSLVVRASADADHLAAGGAQLRAQAGGRGDAAVGDVDRAVGPGSEAGREEQLADTEAGAVAVLVEADHVAGRAGARALVHPPGPGLGRGERAVAAEPAALHGA